MSNFSDWLNKKFLERQESEHKRLTVSAFARYLDVPQASASRWLNGDTTPDIPNLLKIALKFGPETFVMAGVKQPPSYKVIHNYYAPQNPQSIPEGEQTLNRIYNYVESLHLKSVHDREDLTNKLLKENGFVLISTHYELVDSNDSTPDPEKPSS